MNKVLYKKAIDMEVIRVNPSWKKQKMITVGLKKRRYDKKYNRFFFRTTKLCAHYDSEVTPVVGDKIRVVPSRPLSAIKRHIAYPI